MLYHAAIDNDIQGESLLEIFSFSLRNFRMGHREIVSASRWVAEDVISIRFDPVWKEPYTDE